MKYNPITKSNRFVPGANEPFRLSRLRLELYLKCPQCFHDYCCSGVREPRPPGYTLNSAVDNALKQEFDSYREQQRPHPLMKRYGIDAVPFHHASMKAWRDYKKGLAFHHEPTGFILFGIIDDVWQHADGSLSVVDYKSTSTNDPITLEGPYKKGFKRQLDIYQWILQQWATAQRADGLGDYEVNPTAYFVYANTPTKDVQAFNAQLNFEVSIIPYPSDTSWVEEALHGAYNCLMDPKPPMPASDCEMCAYTTARVNLMMQQTSQMWWAIYRQAMKPK